MEIELGSGHCVRQKNANVHSIKSYGALTGNAADDEALVDWLVKEYREAL